MEDIASETIGIFSQKLIVQGTITSLIFITIALLSRYSLIRIVKGKKEILDKDQRRWINRINNSTSVAILIAMIFIWAPQLHTFALSLTAVAVAIVLITKELLMCLTGGFLRASTKPFNVADWITIDGVMGEVMKISATATLIEKIDNKNQSYQFTGETIQIPNSRFLTANIENANFIKSYIYHDTPVAVQFNDVSPEILMGHLKTITQKHYEPFRENAVKFNKQVEKKSAVDFADPEPQYFFRTSDLGHYVFTVRLFLPTRQAAEVSAAISCEFLTKVHALRDSGARPASKKKTPAKSKAKPKKAK